jgi:DNA-binding beta-propeller fold protein YncE
LQLKSFLPSVFIACLIGGAAHAQATFGDVVRLGTTPSDIVLDESRTRLYLVNAAANRVDVWDYSAQTLLGSIPVGTRPLAAAMSMDNAFLYVTNHDSSTLSVISLASGIGGTVGAVALPAQPEGVAVGLDGRVVISTDGSSTTSTVNTLLIYDGTQANAQQVLAVQFPPAAVTPPTLSAPTFPRPTTQFNGKLQRTPDGKYIIGVSSITNNSATVVYQYEVDSGTILQSRTVTGQSSIMAMSPDGASFMAGFTLYSTATLNAVAQQNIANAPFPITTAAGTVNPFSTVANLGGSVFSPDGTTLYSAFNNSVTTTTSASTLLISDPHTLAITLGINLPESVLSKIVITSDGTQAWALSSSGMIHLPLGNLYNYPILMPQSTTVFLAQDNCNPGVAQGSLNINNIGAGTLTFAVPQGLQTAIVATASSGLAPSTITFTMDPGRSTVVRTPGTNLYTNAGSTGAAATNSGTALAVNLVSPNAINIPNTIRVFMNYRDSTQRGQIYPVPTVPYSATVGAATVTEGLQDIVLDQARNLIYITNSGYNRIEVFDIQNRVFLTPIPVGQLPHQMAMGLDGSTLYVANTGGESIAIVDLDQQQVTGSIKFPPIPRLGNANVDSVHTMAMGLSGLEFVLLQPTTPTQTTISGSLWQVIGNNAVPRVGTTVTGVNAAGAQTLLSTANQSSMIGSADGTSILLLGGTGTTYLYDALADSYTASANVFGGSRIFGFYGPVGAASDANFLLADGLVMNNSLTPIGGAAEPGMVTMTPPGPGGFGGISVSSTGLRNVASVAPIDQNNFARLTTPVRTNLTTTITADIHTTLEVVNVLTGAITSTFRVPENPPISFFGNSPQPTPPRQMVIDAQGTAYAITLSGLSVIPLAPATTSTIPALAAHPIVNSVDGTTAFKPGSFVTINGSNLASPATANALPAPTVLGGSCVVMNNVAIPLLQTASGQIAAQIPSNMRAGEVVMQVRSLAMAQNSAPVVVAIQKP